MKMASKNILRRKNTWEWVKYEFPEGVNNILEGKQPEHPMHVEIHPHHLSTGFCNNNCAACTGSRHRQEVKHRQAGIEPGRLIETIGSFKNKIKRVVFSGNCTEPLLYPEIGEAFRQIKMSGLDFALYSNFYYADRPGVLEAMTSGATSNDYSRISINAGSREAYNRTHKPRDKQSYEKVLENVSALLDIKRKNNLNFFVHLTYLLDKHNCDKHNLENAIKWAYEHEGIDGIRFSTYQKPLGKNMPESAIVTDLAGTRSIIEKLGEEYQKEGFCVDVTNEEIMTSQKQKQFSRCYVQNVFGVIGFDGGVYPCTAMASPSNSERYKFGNINYNDFLEIWKAKALKANFPLDKCYDCTRAERAVNCEFQKVLDSRELVDVA
jgi:radical SAM protein with 4Fe4S-binding SPASM domain